LIVNFVKEAEKDTLVNGAKGFEVRQLSSEIWSIRASNYRAYGSIGTDEEGEYFLLWTSQPKLMERAFSPSFFAAKDPERTLLLIQTNNMAIDPNRNMMIDPAPEHDDRPESKHDDRSAPQHDDRPESKHR
jgi:hypothetical protein